MNIHVRTVDYYVDRLKTGDYFSFAGYSDAEWYCILGERVGELTALGQKISATHGEKLLKVIERRQHDARFLFAVPYCLHFLPAFENRRIEKFLLSNCFPPLKCYERDILTDSLAEHAGLFPLVHQLQLMETVIIGNRHLRGLDFLGYNHFVEISSPNLHLEDGGIERAIGEARDYGKPSAYLVSAGVSAAVIIDGLHDAIPNSFFIDCGSIWDAFVGIGEQREWRAKLYRNRLTLERWIHDNIYGKKQRQP